MIRKLIAIPILISGALVLWVLDKTKAVIDGLCQILCGALMGLTNWVEEEE